MTEANLRAQIDAAKAYEVLMVPALFGEWAPTVAVESPQFRDQALGRMGKL